MHVNEIIYALICMKNHVLWCKYSMLSADAAPTRRIYLFYLDIIYNGYSALRYIRKGIQPIRLSGVINPTFFFNLFCVGLKSHTVVLIAGMWINAGRWIDGASKIHASIVWTADHRSADRARGFNVELWWLRFNAPKCIATVGSRSNTRKLMHFLTHIMRIHLERPSGIWRLWHFS